MSAKASTVYFTGGVNRVACGVRAYGELLAAALRTRGLSVEEHWIVSEGATVGAAIGAMAAFFRLALRIPRKATVVWHYAAYAHAFRGLSSPAVLFGMLCALRGVKVVTIVHEPGMAAAPGLPLRKRLHVWSQRAALRIVAKSSSALIVTTERRAAELRQRLGVSCRVAPVFSNLPLGPSSIVVVPPGRRRIGVFGFGAANSRPDIVFGGVRAVAGHDGVEILMVGAPGRDSKLGALWSRAAEEFGVTSIVSYTGVVSIEEVAAQLRACEIVVLPYDEGPNGRKGTLAGVLGLGCVVVAPDGPDCWDLVKQEGAVRIIEPDAAALTRALEELLRDPDAREAQRHRAREFYVRHQTIEVTTQAIVDLL